MPCVGSDTDLFVRLVDSVSICVFLFPRHDTIVGLGSAVSNSTDNEIHLSKMLYTPKVRVP